MRIVPTLLRAILVLSLVLNGTGLAAAHAGSAGVQATQEVPAFSTAQEAPLDEPPCHEALEHGGAVPPGNVTGDAVEDQDGRMSGHQPGADCCDMDMVACAEACAQTLPAALPAAARADVNSSPATHPQTMDSARPGPPLPHPIRPPIG